MKILVFAYRDWAKAIFEYSCNWFAETEIIDKKNLVNIDFIDYKKPNIILFYGWSWKVDADIINKYRCFCLHPSPLPKYRGGSPIQHQIMNGEKKAAVTIFRMTDIMDAGQIYYQEYFELNGYLTDIFETITHLGVVGTEKLINDYNRGKILTKPQNGKATTYKRLTNNNEIKPEDFLKYNAEYFYNKVRGLQDPYPECFIKCKKGKIILKHIEHS